MRMAANGAMRGTRTSDEMRSPTAPSDLTRGGVGRVVRRRGFGRSLLRRGAFGAERGELAPRREPFLRTIGSRCEPRDQREQTMSAIGSEGFRDRNPATSERRWCWPGAASTPASATGPGDYAILEGLFASALIGLMVLTRRRERGGRPAIPLRDLPRAGNSNVHVGRCRGKGARVDLDAGAVRPRVS